MIANTPAAHGHGKAAEAQPIVSSARSLHEQVKAEQRALQWRARASHAAVGLAAAAAMLAIASALLAGGRWIVWPRALPVLLWTAVIGVVVMAVRWYVRQQPARVAMQDVVSDIERDCALRDGALRGALELQASVPDTTNTQHVRSAPPLHGTPGHALAAYAIEQVRAEILARAPRTRASRTTLAPTRRAVLQRRALHAGATALVCVVALLAVGRSASDGMAAMVHPINAWRGTLLPAITFDNLPVEVARGRPFTVAIVAPARTTVRVLLQRDGAVSEERTIVVNDGRATVDVGVMLSTLSLRVDDGRSLPIDTTVRVIDRPWVGDVRIDARYPQYLGRPGETLDLSAPVRVPKGTELTVYAVAHAGARDLRLVSSDATETVSFTSIAGYGESARVSAMTSRRYLWQARGTDLADESRSDTTGTVDVPAPLDITVVDDAVPVVQLAAQLESDLIAPSMDALFVVQANDDHGLDRVALEFRRERSGDGKGTVVVVPGESASSSRDVRAELMVRELWSEQAESAPLSMTREVVRAFDALALQPGDRVTVVATARDKSPWRQRGVSNAVVLRVPTVAEQRELARALSDSLVSRVSALSAAERALAEQTANAARSRELSASNRPNPDASPSANDAKSSASSAAKMSQASADQMKTLAQQQRQLGDRVDALRNDTDALEKRLADAGAMDAAMAQQFRELQQLLRDAMTPDMMEQLAALERSADRLSGSEVKQSLEQLLARQQQMREQLERSAELLKRAALEGAMETLRDDAQELADAQRQVSERLKEQDAVPPRDVQSLADRSERVADAVETLADRLRREGADVGAQRASEAKRAADAAANAMQQAAQSSQQSQRAPETQAAQASAAAASAERAATSMEQAAEQLSAARDEQVAAWKQDLASELDQAINETAQLARQQAELANRAQQQGQPGGQQSGQSGGQQEGGQQQGGQQQGGQQQGGQQQGGQQQGGQQPSGDVRGAQSALQQGVQQAAARLEQAARGSSLLSQRSQRAMAEAQQKVQQATQAAAQASGSSAGGGRAGGTEQMEGAMRDASAALNQALASMVRDRERVNTASSASGFQEMMQQLKELAEQQSAVNGQMQGLSMMPGGAQGQGAQQQARVLARQQRQVAEGLQEVADVDPSGRLEALAQEAEQVAQSVARTGVADAAALARQQQLYRRMLDAGRMLEQEERDDRGERESQAGDGRGTTTRDGTQSGRAAQKFTPPAWTDLRTLSPEERRAVSEYFRKLNGREP